MVVTIGRYEGGRAVYPFVLKNNALASQECAFSRAKAKLRHTHVYSRIRPFDICLLPYAADDPFNINCSPLMLYEYLAIGKPIVSTNLPAVRPFDGIVRIAQDTDEFARHIAAALMERDEGLRQRRLAVAQENSWERQAENIVKILNPVLARRTRGMF